MNLSLLLPEILLAVLAFALMGADLLLPSQRKPLLPLVSLLGLIVVILSTFGLMGQSTSLFDGLVLIDSYAVFFKFFFLILAIFIILASWHYVPRQVTHPVEYYGFVLLATLGMMLMAAAGELLTAYIALELVSFSLYVLVSFEKYNPKSNEGGMKYMLLGAFSSAILLYGLSVLYGITQTTTFAGIAAALSRGESLGPGLLLALVLITAGLGFKVAAVPFHMWAPDAYEGAPIPVTAYLAVASKAAGFALLLRLFGVALLPALDQWRFAIALLAALTMTVGNLVAIQQHNIKRLLAYSSIGQVGYLLVGIAALATEPEQAGLAASAILFHLVGYAATNLAAFLGVIVYFNLTAKEEIPDYAGLAERAPFVALVLTASLFSLAGLPFFAGFVTKFYLFTAAVQAGLLWLVFLAIVNSLVSFYYYLLIIKQMYIHQPTEPGRLPVPIIATGTLALLLGAVLLIGVYPGPLVELLWAASRFLFA